MSSSRRHRERDLFELGYANQNMLERADRFWFTGTEEDFTNEAGRLVPGVLQNLVSELHEALQDLDGWGLEKEVENLAVDADATLTKASEAYEQRWGGDIGWRARKTPPLQSSPPRRS